VCTGGRIVRSKQHHTSKLNCPRLRAGRGGITSTATAANGEGDGGGRWGWGWKVGIQASVITRRSDLVALDHVLPLPARHAQTGYAWVGHAWTHARSGPPRPNMLPVHTLPTCYRSRVHDPASSAYLYQYKKAQKGADPTNFNHRITI
jgi:hypothetical protein